MHIVTKVSLNCKGTFGRSWNRTHDLPAMNQTGLICHSRACYRYTNLPRRRNHTSSSPICCGLCCAITHCLPPYAIFSVCQPQSHKLSTDFVCWALCQSAGCIVSEPLCLQKLPQLPTPSTTPPHHARFDPGSRDGSGATDTTSLPHPGVNPEPLHGVRA